MGVSVTDLPFLYIGNVIAYDRHYLDVEFAGDMGDKEPLHRPAELALNSLHTGQSYFLTG